MLFYQLLLLKHLLEAELIDGSCLTVTGKTIAENLKNIPAIPVDQDLIAPINQPFKEHADMQICFGNLAPGGIVFKVSSMEQPSFRGHAICFDEAKEIVDAVEAKLITPGSVIILRNLGDHMFVINQNDVWLSTVENIKFLSKIFLTMAMAAIGLSTNFRDIKNMGYKPFLVGFIAMATVGLISIITIQVFINYII